MIIYLMLTKEIRWIYVIQTCFVLIVFEAIISLLELQDLPNWSPAFRLIPFYLQGSHNDLFAMMNRCLTSWLGIVPRDFLLNIADWSKVFFYCFCLCVCLLQVHCKEMSFIALGTKAREETKHVETCGKHFREQKGIIKW